MKFGFEELGLNKVYAVAMTKNPASSSVMLKLGMKQEGIFSQHIRKWDQYEDVAYYGIQKFKYEEIAEHYISTFK